MFVWSIVLSLIALAISAWVKWKIAAGGLILGVFFAGAGFGSAINAVMRTDKGSLIDIARMMATGWGQLLRYNNGGISATQAWIVLAIVSLICLWLLSKKVRAFEVVS